MHILYVHPLRSLSTFLHPLTTSLSLTSCPSPSKLYSHSTYFNHSCWSLIKKKNHTYQPTYSNQTHVHKRSCLQYQRILMWNLKKKKQLEERVGIYRLKKVKKTTTTVHLRVAVNLKLGENPSLSDHSVVESPYGLFWSAGFPELNVPAPICTSGHLPKHLVPGCTRDKPLPHKTFSSCTCRYTSVAVD